MKWVDKYRSLPVDDSKESPVRQWGAVHGWRLGDYWTVPANVSLRELEDVDAVVQSKSRLASIRRARMSGIALPPIELGVFRDGSVWLVDGNHRLAEARKAGLSSVPASFTFVGQSAPLLATNGKSKRESEADHYATYLIDRRDPVREEKLAPERRALLRSWIVARAKLAQAAGRGATSVMIDDRTSLSLLPPKFGVVYGSLERADEAELGEWAADIAAMEAAVDKTRTRASAERSERAYERQAVTVDTSMTQAQRDRKLRGKKVWLYHGTSTALLDEISREGLTPDQKPIEPDTTTPGYVYLTAEVGSWSQGGSAWFYARRAAAKFGGEPAILRVIVDFDDLEPDEDDADLRSYLVQYRTATPVPVGAIMEIDGQRLREKYGS